MTSLSRREFAALAAAAAAAPFALDPTCVAASGAAATLTARQLIDRITSQLGAPAKPDTVDGLKAGERVVTQATFLIDAESNIRAALAAFGAGEAK